MKEAYAKSTDMTWNIWINFKREIPVFMPTVVDFVDNLDGGGNSDRN